MAQLQLQGSSSLHTMVPVGIYPDDEGERGEMDAVFYSLGCMKLSQVFLICVVGSP